MTESAAEPAKPLIWSGWMDSVVSKKISVALKRKDWLRELFGRRRNEEGLTPREFAKKVDVPDVVKILETYDVPYLHDIGNPLYLLV